MGNRPMSTHPSITMPCHHPQQPRGYITDQASESLHSVRSKRAENKGRLRTLMDEQVGQGALLSLSRGEGIPGGNFNHVQERIY